MMESGSELFGFLKHAMERIDILMIGVVYATVEEVLNELDIVDTVPIVSLR